MKGPKCKLCGQEHFGLCPASTKAVDARMASLTAPDAALAAKAEKRRADKALKARKPAGGKKPKAKA